MVENNLIIKMKGEQDPLSLKGAIDALRFLDFEGAAGRIGDQTAFVVSGSRATCQAIRERVSGIERFEFGGCPENFVPIETFVARKEQEESVVV